MSGCSGTGWIRRACWIRRSERRPRVLPWAALPGSAPDRRLQATGKGKSQGPGWERDRGRVGKQTEAPTAGTESVPEQGRPAPDSEDSSGDRTPEELLFSPEKAGQPEPARAGPAGGQGGRRQDRPGASRRVRRRAPPRGGRQCAFRTGRAQAGQGGRGSRSPAEGSRSGGGRGKPDFLAPFCPPEGGLRFFAAAERAAGTPGK